MVHLVQSVQSKLVFIGNIYLSTKRTCSNTATLSLNSIVLPSDSSLRTIEVLLEFIANDPCLLS